MSKTCNVMPENEKQLVLDTWVCLHDFSKLSYAPRGKKYVLSIGKQNGSMAASTQVYLSKAEALKISEALNIKMGE